MRSLMAELLHTLLCNARLRAVRSSSSQGVLHGSGEGQPELAQEARAAIFEQKERAFRCTLPSRSASGHVKWTLFEMWPNFVRVLRIISAPCMLHVHQARPCQDHLNCHHGYA